MEIKELMPALVDIHNRLIEINVHGDDVIRMADVLQKCRALVFQMQKETEQSADQ